jgi:hypothetical protein
MLRLCAYNRLNQGIHASSSTSRGTTFIAINCGYHSVTGRNDGLGTYLLEKKLGGVRNRKLCDMLGALAEWTPAIIPHQSTLLARVYFELVG